MIKWICGRLGVVFGAFLMVLTPATAADEQQTNEALLQEVFTNIEAITIAIGNEHILTSMGYGLTLNAESPTTLPTIFREQIDLSRQTAQAHFTQLINLQPQIEAAQQGASLEGSAFLTSLFVRTADAFHTYQELHSGIDHDLQTSAETHELSGWKIQRGVQGLKEALGALQRHFLFSYSGQSSALFHLRANLLVMQDYAAREAASLGEDIASGQPISLIQKGRADRYGGSSLTAWENVQSIMDTGILPKAFAAKRQNLQEIFFDEFVEIRFSLYDISDFAFDEASDPDNVTVDYERTAEDWFMTTERVTASALSLLEAVATHVPPQETEANILKIDADTLFFLISAGLLVIAVLLLILRIRRLRNNADDASIYTAPHAAKQEVDMLVQEMNALSNKVNNLAKRHS